MDNFTSCEEYYKHLNNIESSENMSLKRFPYPDNAEYWKRLDAVEYTKLIAYTVVMFGGLLGNISVILTVALIRSVRNAVNFYVANLAVTDALICAICMLPHALSQSNNGQFVFDAFTCKFTSFIQITCLTSSVLTLCAISCDRFMAVFRPLQVRTTEKRTRFVIAVIWIISIVVSSPFLIIKNLIFIEWKDYTEAYCVEIWPVIHYFDERTNTCEVRHYIREIYHIVLCIALYFMPVLIMIMAYSAILYKLWTSDIPGEQNEANVQAHSRSKQKVLKMVIVVLIVFIVCWTPLQVLLFIKAFGMNFEETKQVPTWHIELEWFSYFIAYANSFVNPFIYGQYNKEFRNGFCLVLCCRHRRRKIERFSGENIFTKSLRSMNTTLSNLRNSTEAFISRRVSRSNDLGTVETRV